MSHSRELNRGSTVTSKKSFRANVNGGPFVAKAPYNDVYGGPPEFGVASLSPRPEDYSEIFGSFHVSRASSIPILDLPELDEKEVFFDVRSSSFDYSEVFGGFDCLDFAATYEELTKQSNEGDGDSSEEAWTPAGTESLSDDSDHSSKTQCMFNGDSDLSFDQCTEFKISYNQAYQSGKEDMSNGITHVTQVNEVPGFTYLVDGTDLRGQDDENQSFHANDDGYFNIDLNMGPNESKPAKKKASQPPNAIYERQSFENGPQTPKGSDKSSSFLDESFITISEINLRTEPSQVPPPSRPPPIIGVKKLYSKLDSNSDYVFPEGISDDSSPPFFDVEVDASSSAAASAAAMKEVMEKARAKLLSAKELMERKKEGVHNRGKQHFKYDIQDKEGSVSKLLDRSNNGNDEKRQDTCEIVENEMTVSVTDEMKKDKEVQVSFKGEKLLKVAHKFAENKFKDDDIDDSREWKEAAGLFEVKPDNSRKATKLVKNENISGRTVKTEKDIVIEALEQLGENDNEVDAVLKVHGLENTREAEGKYWQEDDNMRSKPATVLNSQRDYELSEGTLCNYDLKEDEKNCEITYLSVEKKGSREADKPVKYEVLVEVKHNNNGGELEQTITKANGKRKSQDINGRNDNDSKLKEIIVVRENELGDMEGIQHLEMEGKLTESFEMSDCEKRLKNIHGQDENERVTEDTLEALSTEKRLEDDLQEGNGAKPPKKRSEKEVVERLKDDEEYEKKLQDIHERWENILTKHKKHPKEKDCRKKLEEINNKEPSEMEIKEAGKQDKIEATADDASQYKEFVRMFEDHERGELKEKKLADRAQAQIGMEPSKVCDEVFEVDNEYQAMQQHGKHDQCRERVEATQGFLGHNESGDKMGEHKINKIQLDSTGMMHLESAEDVNAFYRGEEVFIDLDWQVRPEDVEKSLSVDDSGNKDIDISSKMTYCDIETDPDVPPIAENVKASGVSYIFEVLENDQIKMKEEKNVLTQDESEKKGTEVGISNGHQHFVKMNCVPKVISGPDHEDSKYDQERGEQGKGLNIKGNKEKFVSTHVVKERAEKENKCEAYESHVSGGKENTPNLASEVNAGQFIARKDKIMNDTLLVGDREAERMKKKQELKNDRLRMEEEKEREREREKDRMIIDRTILEGRKENNEGHAEKAAMERAIAEAQRKAMLEARERLEKACAEAREKSLSGKVALEARVRAERAAVDRANAEARERAFEKAMAEKSVFESRERMERSFSDKLSASSRGTVMRQSSSFNDMPDLQFQRTDTSSGSRYTYSSSNGEVSEGVNGESAQRCKARLERHRRTAERAAKALAEKNMRDILAQREQVERNRLAETLDADVRRWSSGKEGNLRALLSTLQYILWPDSGWQPVPLTEVITAAAVKKAYRKATLCVHPDKLQQRGASIQQKYICEKVFDLLKEAWNKFNSEER